MRHSIKLSLLAAIAMTSACGCGSPEKVNGGTLESFIKRKKHQTKPEASK